jgi:hypothetical protein
MQAVAVARGIIIVIARVLMANGMIVMTIMSVGPSWILHSPSKLTFYSIKSALFQSQNQSLSPIKWQTRSLSLKLRKNVPSQHNLHQYPQITIVIRV